MYPVLQRLNKKFNLNSVVTDGSGAPTHPIPLDHNNVEILFTGQRGRIIELIQESTMVVGCMAWLTDLAILASLRDRKVCIIVNKEDFLRPDSTDHSDHNKKLREAYSKLGGFGRENMTVLYDVHNLMTEDEAGVRCVGMANIQKQPAWPRMHHKFLICRFDPLPDEDNKCRPIASGFQAVITGSYNMTFNATNSFENTIILNNREWAEQFYKEFEYLFGLSEPLDWDTPWVAPEYRVGT